MYKEGELVFIAFSFVSIMIIQYLNLVSAIAFRKLFINLEYIPLMYLFFRFRLFDPIVASFGEHDAHVGFLCLVVVLVGRVEAGFQLLQIFHE